MTIVLASARTDIAGYLSTLIYVYTLLIIVYIVINLLFAVGPATAVLAHDRPRARLPARRRASPTCASSGASRRGSAASTSARCWRSFRCRSSTSWSSRASSAEHSIRMMGSPPTPPSPPARASTPSLDRPGESPQRAHGASVAWLLAALVMVCVVVIDQLTKHCGRSLDRPRRRTQGPARRPARVHAQPRRRLRLPARQPRGRDDPDRRSRYCYCSCTSRGTPRSALLWLPTGMIARRRARQHHRPAAPRLGHRLHQAAARLAAVQPRRRLDHARRRAPVRAGRPRAHSDRVSDEQHAPFTIAFQDEHLLVVDKAPGVVVHPARGHREDTLSQLLAPLLDDGRRETQSAAGSCTASTATPPGCSSSPAATRLMRRLQTALARRLIEREYLALVEGRPPARTGTIEAPIGRDPRVRTRMAVGGAGAREARTHFTLERALAGQLAAAPAPRDRAHPPDPRAPAGDRTSGVRRPRVRHRRALRAGAPVPARRRGSPSSTRSPASSVDVSSPLPPDLQSALSSAPKGYPDSQV